MDEGLPNFYSRPNGRKVIGTVVAQFESFNIDSNMNMANEAMNLNVHKACWVETPDISS